MKKRFILISVTLLAVLAIVFPVRGAVLGLMPAAQPAEVQQEIVINGMNDLLNYPHDVTITPLEGDDYNNTLAMLMGRAETIALMTELANKNLHVDPLDPLNTEVMRIEIPIGLTGADTVIVDAMTTSAVFEDAANDLLLSVALTAMLPQDGSEGFFQAHHTNLDPHLADLPDPVIYFNGMHYFYITTLRWIGGRIVYWNYWWFDSGHHPNWYYAHYYWYWRYYGWYYGGFWPYWYWWAHGWYYWHYWYYWSTWFPF